VKDGNDEETNYHYFPPAEDDASFKMSLRKGRVADGEGGWCNNSKGVFCMLLNAWRGGEKAGGTDRVDVDAASSSANRNGLPSPSSLAAAAMTPCPSAVEYVTPVFAKNYQGVWRYVVQIPYEGYFTQTVEVVKCL